MENLPSARNLALLPTTHNAASMPCAKMLINTPKMSHLKWSSGKDARQVALLHRERLIAAWPVICDIMRPSTVQDINAVIETLTQMFYERERNDAQYELWLDAYTTALKPWPVDLLWLACKKWISDGKPHFPSPSDLKRCIKSEYLERMTIYNRARMAVEWLEANPDERPFVATDKTREIADRVARLLKGINEALDKGEELEKSQIKELYQIRDNPEVDAMKADLERRRARAKIDQKKRNERFMKNPHAKPIAPSIQSFILKNKGGNNAKR